MLTWLIVGAFRATSRLLFVGRINWTDRVDVDAVRLERLDVRQPIDYPAVYLQIARPATLPAPLFKSAWRYQPALRETLLVEMLHNEYPVEHALVSDTARTVTQENVGILDRFWRGQLGKRRDIAGRKTRGFSKSLCEKRDLFIEKRDLVSV
jgi:hypothetical protein